MKWLTEKLAGINQIGLVQRSLLPTPGGQELCTWFDICPYIKRYRKFEREGLLDKNEENEYRYSKVCTTDLFPNCERYKSITQEQLKKFSVKLKHISIGEAQVFLNALPREIYQSYSELLFGKGAETSVQQGEKSQKSHRRCALDPPTI